AGKKVVVAGYGWGGRGLGTRAKGHGGDVLVTEVDAVKALEAVMDGFRVMKMEEAAAVGDIFITVTGDVNVLDRHHFSVMKDGVLLANSGHFNSEINLKALDDLATGVRQVRPSVQEYRLADGPRLHVLGGGGARGAAQVGVLQGLFEAGVEPPVRVVAVSVGALNGSAIAAYPSLAGVMMLRELWVSPQAMSVFRMHPLGVIMTGLRREG